MYICKHALQTLQLLPALYIFRQICSILLTFENKIIHQIGKFLNTLYTCEIYISNSELYTMMMVEKV